MTTTAISILVKTTKVSNSVSTRDQCKMAEAYCRNAIRYISAMRPDDIGAGYAIHLLQEHLNRLFIKWYTCL